MSLFDELPSTIGQLWGVIWSAVNEKQTTYDLWETTKAAATQMGVSTQGWTIQDMNTLRSAAAQVRGAEQNMGAAMDLFTSTGLNQEITPQMWTYAPWGRGMLGEAEWGSEDYRLRVQVLQANPAYTAGVEGAPEQITSWLTLKTSTRPTTTAELQDMVASLTADASKYPEGAVQGVVTAQLLAV